MANFHNYGSLKNLTNHYLWSKQKTFLKIAIFFVDLYIEQWSRLKCAIPILFNLAAEWEEGLANLKCMLCCIENSIDSAITKS